jgi:hypothetical protein
MKNPIVMNSDAPQCNFEFGPYRIVAAPIFLFSAGAQQHSECDGFEVR